MDHTRLNVRVCISLFYYDNNKTSFERPLYSATRDRMTVVERPFIEAYMSGVKP